MDKPVLFVVVANEDYYPDHGLGDVKCVTEDWRVAYHVYIALRDTAHDKTISVWELQDGKCREVRMDNESQESEAVVGY